MLTDRIRVDFRSGRGGNGAVKFWGNGKPCGGNGGKGGDVYLEGSKNLYDLNKFVKADMLEAGDGDSGGHNQIQGKSGDDLIVKVPLTTVVFSIDEEEILRIDKEGERKLLLSGGFGGRGNYVFRAGQVKTLKKCTPGGRSTTLSVILELRLFADVIFIGLPNAGKSSMLNSLTNSNVEVAPYPFTTIQPNLGVCGNLILMDLPGLIEGASQGKGLGTKFLQHAENAKLIAHFISVENDDVCGAYESIRKEIDQMESNLREKDEMILLTKIDLVDEDVLKQKVKQLEKYGKKVIPVSIYKFEELKELSKVLHNAVGK